MKPFLRSLLSPLLVIVAAGAVAWFWIEREERTTRAGFAKTTMESKADRYALRLAAVESARKSYQVSLETERLAFEREKQEADVPELAELSHEVRQLRIELEHKKTLAAIDQKYPPPFPKPEPPVPEPPAPLPLPVTLPTTPPPPARP